VNSLSQFYRTAAGTCPLGNSISAIGGCFLLGGFVKKPHLSPADFPDQTGLECSANRLRSPTAEQVFSTWPGVETDSAGLSSGATVLLSAEQVEWADIIFVMEKAHRQKLARRFRRHLKNKRVICLDIPDDYAFMDPVLIRALENRVGRFLTQPARAVSEEPGDSS